MKTHKRQLRPAPALESLERRLVLTGGNSVYVDSLYQAELQRSAAPAELTAWNQLLQSGAETPTGVATAIINSPEHRQLQVEQDYRTFLNRSADSAGVQAFVNEYESGASDAQIERAFIDSPEYNADHPDNASFVASLYQNVLDRSPDPSGQSALENELQQGMSRDQIAQDVLNSPEELAKVVSGDYQEGLNRQPSASEDAGWVNLLASGQMTESQVEAQILGSPEDVGDHTLETRG